MVSDLDKILDEYYFKGTFFDIFREICFSFLDLVSRVPNLAFVIQIGCITVCRHYEFLLFNALT